MFLEAVQRVFPDYMSELAELGRHAHLAKQSDEDCDDLGEVTVEGSWSSKDLLPLTVVLSVHNSFNVLIPLKSVHLFQTKYE